MKTIKSIVIVLILFSQLTFSQKKIEYGINAGINYSNIRGNDFIENFNYDYGFIIGLTLEYSLKNNLSIITGINYEGKNSISDTYDYSNPNGIALGNTETKYKFSFLSLPMLLKLNFADSFFINGGPYFSYLLSANSKTAGINKMNETDTFKKVDFGLSLGIGKQFQLNEKNNLNIQIKNNLGIININDVPSVNGGTIKTNSLNLILGLTF